jgi:hypothetical protein
MNIIDYLRVLCVLKKGVNWFCICWHFKSEFQWWIFWFQWPNDSSMTQQIFCLSWYSQCSVLNTWCEEINYNVLKHLMQTLKALQGCLVCWGTIYKLKSVYFIEQRYFESATTFSIMTLRRMTFSIIGLFVTLSIIDI